MASAAEVRRLLAATTVPVDEVDDLLAGVSALWLLSASAPLLAADLALCHPDLHQGEVRASAREAGEGFVRLTVVATDRVGLLADTAGVLAAEGLSIVAASATSWAERRLALHAVVVRDAGSAERWEGLRRRLRGLGDNEIPAMAFSPQGPVHVRASAAPLGRSVLTVQAPDDVGLLWSVCRWLADRDISVESARVGGTEGVAHDQFVVIGAPDPVALRDHLGGGPAARPTLLAKVRERWARAGAGH